MSFVLKLGTFFIRRMEGVHNLSNNLIHIVHMEIHCVCHVHTKPNHMLVHHRPQYVPSRYRYVRPFDLHARHHILQYLRDWEKVHFVHHHICDLVVTHHVPRPLDLYFPSAYGTTPIHIQMARNTSHAELVPTRRHASVGASEFVQTYRTHVGQLDRLFVCRYLITRTLVLPSIATTHTTLVLCHLLLHTSSVCLSLLSLSTSSYFFFISYLISFLGYSIFRVILFFRVFRHHRCKVTKIVLYSSNVSPVWSSR